MENIKLTSANFSHKTRKTLISENVLEVDAGLKIHGFEEFDLGFANDNPRVERIVSYKKDNNILTFYIGVEEFVSLKVLDVSKGFKCTSMFPSISIRDIPAIIKLIGS